jgi:hypothetical protein
MSRLRKVSVTSSGGIDTSSNPTYNFLNPKVKFLANNRVYFQVELQEGKSQPILIHLETGLNIINGRQINLVNPVAAVNGEEVPPQFLNIVANNVNKKLDLVNLEAEGLLLRIIKLEMRPIELEIVAFLRIEPSSRFLETPPL